MNPYGSWVIWPEFDGLWAGRSRVDAAFRFEKAVRDWPPVVRWLDDTTLAVPNRDARGWRKGSGQGEEHLYRLRGVNLTRLEALEALEVWKSNPGHDAALDSAEAWHVRAVGLLIRNTEADWAKARRSGVKQLEKTFGRAKPKIDTLWVSADTGSTPESAADSVPGDSITADTISSHVDSRGAGTVKGTAGQDSMEAERESGEPSIPQNSGIADGRGLNWIVTATPHHGKEKLAIQPPQVR